MNTAVSSSSLIISKFGGTSVADYPSMSRCADIIISNPRTTVVVVSASAGITNLLIALAKGIPAIMRRQHIHKIATIQEAILTHLTNPTAVKATIYRLMNNITALANAATLATSAALTDELVSHGELLSSYLFTEILKQKQAAATWFDIRPVMRTDTTFGHAIPQLEAIKQRCRTYLVPYLVNQIIVTQGFIGSDASGRTTTLGRGGSDYSAALLGEALGATQIAIWSDVAGIYTTDPNIVRSAKRIDKMTFHEATEMATFGAKILHPATLIPALRCNIPVFVGSSHEKNAGGTVVCSEKYVPKTLPHFRAISVRRQQTLLTLRSLDGRNSCGFLALVFAIMAAAHVSVDLVSTSETSIALTLDPSGNKTGGTDALSDILLTKLADICHVNIEKNLAVVALIGNHLSSTKGVMAAVFHALSAYAIRLSCSGASEHSVCLLVNDDEANNIITLLHNTLFD